MISKDAPIWIEVKRRTEQMWTELNERLATIAPQATLVTGRWGNERSPFWSWATFRKARDEELELVLTEAFEIDGVRLRRRADLMIEQGPIVLEVPDRIFAANASPDQLLEGVQGFVEAAIPEIVRRIEG